MNGFLFCLQLVLCHSADLIQTVGHQKFATQDLASMHA